MKVLQLSQRRVSDLVAYCLAYELEDTVATVTNVERIEVTDAASLEFSRRCYKLARRLSGSPDIAYGLAPAPRHRIKLDRDYDLFFPIFSHTYELHSLLLVRNWRQRCGKAVCFITEVGSEAVPSYLVELLAEFDHIFVGCRHGVRQIGQITGRPCTYLPLAVDVPKFAPASLDELRPIDVCNIGRRSAVTHKALLEDADRRSAFYYFDTIAASGSDRKSRTFRVDAPSEHRRMLATILKHSRIYIANRSYVNKPGLPPERDEVSSRFYEGAASGTVMVGEAPRTEEFRRQFDWQDALIEMPFDTEAVGAVLSEIHGNSDRVRAIRRRNVRAAARRHDWLHRLEVVFASLGLAPTREMLERAQLLERIAARADDASRPSLVSMRG